MQLCHCWVEMNETLKIVPGRSARWLKEESEKLQFTNLWPCSYVFRWLSRRFCRVTVFSSRELGLMTKADGMAVTLL